MSNESDQVSDLAERYSSTLFALSHAVLGHEHIPACLHIDNGSGFINKMMNDKAHGSA